LGPTLDPKPFGCEELKIRLAAVKPRLHVFGHIHGSYGVAKSGKTTYVNASTCCEDYLPRNRPIVVDLTPSGVKVHGTHNPRKEQLDAIQAVLETTRDSPVDEATQVRVALQMMADFQGKPMPALAEEHLKRNLMADLKNLQRTESKPIRRPVPVRDLTE
jgi:hypothetical protein